MNKPNTIMVVDDDMALRQLVADMLAQDDYQVRAADSGELALAAVAARPPDLILLDIRMPGMDGLEVLRRLQACAESHDIPVILLSGVTEMEQRVEGLRLGAVDFIGKPFEREELLARVRTRLELHQLRRQFKQQAAELQQKNDELTWSYHAQVAMNNLLRVFPEATMAGLLNRALRVLLSLDWLKPDARGAIFLTNETGTKLHLLAHQGFSEAQFAACATVPLGRCLCGKAAATGRIHFAACVDDRLHNAPTPAAAPHGHYCVPIMSDAGVLGVINLYLEAGHVHDSREEDILNAAANALAEGILRKRAEEALRQSDKELREAQRLAHIGSWRWTLATDAVTWSEDLYLIAGRDPRGPAPTYAEMSACYTPESWQRLSAAVTRALQNGEAYELDLEMVRPDGTPRLLSGRGEPDYDASGKLVGLHGIVQDITERKWAEAVAASLHEKETLLKEIHHRVKNNLQIISSLLRLQSTQIKSPEARAAFANMQGRVHSMALIHQTLYGSENLARIDMAHYIRKLCTHLYQALVPPTSKLQFQYDLAPITLAINQAIPCGLLINELVSNSLKHAFPEGHTDGEIRITFRPVGNGPAVRLHVHDTGIGLPAGQQMESMVTLGLQLATDLSRQLGGCLERDSGPGTAFSVTFTPEHP